MSADFILVRHGNTFAPGEAPRRIGARTDVPLVETGRRQAHALGTAFAAQGRRFDRILCGPLLRHRETAGLIAAALHRSPPLIITPWLDEIDHGPDENQAEGTVVERIGRAALDAWDREGTVPPGWRVDRTGRLAGWTHLFRHEPAVSTLLVTSGGAARFALLADAGLGRQARSGMKLRTGAYGTIRREGDSALRLTAWNVRPDEDVRSG